MKTQISLGRAAWNRTKHMDHRSIYSWTFAIA
nr:MAG TPA: hypothetical protein [Caudoviricetes sp.]